MSLLRQQTIKPLTLKNRQVSDTFAFSVTPAAFDEIVAKLKADERVEEVHDVSENAKGLKTYWYRDIEGNFSHLIYRPEPLM